MKKRNSILCGFFAVVLAAGILMAASGDLRIPIPFSGATTGDIVYVDKTDNTLKNLASTTAGSILMFNGASAAPTTLTPGASGETLQGTGVTAAPAYVAKNTYREATIHNFATLAAAWTLSADEALCLFLSGTNANAANTIIGPATSGKVFFFRNATGQATQFTASATTGVSITSAKSAWVMYSAAHSDYVKMGSEF